MTQHAKVQSDCPSGGVPANGWNITLAWFLVFYYPFFARVPILNNRNDFHAVWFIGCQSHALASQEGLNCKTFPYSPFCPPKTPKGVNRRAFSSLMRKILKIAYLHNYNTDYNHIFHSDKDHQLRFMDGPNTRSGRLIGRVCVCLCHVNLTVLWTDVFVSCDNWKLLLLLLLVELIAATAYDRYAKKTNEK